MSTKNPKPKPLLRVGSKVLYRSDSGRTYEAVVTEIPETGQYPAWDPDTRTVSLEFRDERQKLVRKTRVLHLSHSGGSRKVWVLHGIQGRKTT